MIPRRHIPTLLTLLFSGLVLWLLWRRLDARSALATLLLMDRTVLVLCSLAALLLSYLQSAELYRQALLSFAERITFRQSLAATAGGISVRMALPGGTGGFFRAAFVKRAYGISFSMAVLAMLAIFWLKLVCLFALSLGGWAWGGAAHPGAGVYVLAGLLAFLLGSACACWLLPRLLGFLTSLGHVGEALGRAGERIRSLGTSLRLSHLFFTLLHALVSVAAEVGLFSVLLHATGSRGLSWPTLAFYYPLCMMGAKVPVSFLGLGAREALVVLLLSHRHLPADLLASSVALSLLAYLLPALLGTIFTWHFFKKIFSVPGPAA